MCDSAQLSHLDCRAFSLVDGCTILIWEMRIVQTLVKSAIVLHIM